MVRAVSTSFMHVAFFLVIIIPCSHSGIATVVTEPLTLAAFNVRDLGVSKMAKDEVVDVLVRLLARYDIVLIQEIVDATETVVQYLTDRLNTDSVHEFRAVVSPRVGRRVFEQYAYIYRSDRVRVERAHVFPDVDDNFEREPFIATFKTADVRYLRQFAIVGIHTKPSQAAEEIDSLSEVLDYVREELDVSDVIIMGDLNAGCGYVTQKDWETNRLRQRPDVTWEIADHVDTTVYSSNCAYDRIILAGERLTRAVVESSVGPFRYDEAWGISPELALAVSDHYPVQLQMVPRTRPAATRHLRPLSVLSVTDRRTVRESDVTAMVEARDTAGYVIEPLYDRQGNLVKVEASFPSYKLSGEKKLSTLVKFQKIFPTVISDYALGLLQYKISHGGLDDVTVYEKLKRPRWYAQVSCSVRKPPPV